MTERKIICKIKIGSYLYGTNRPDSDLDFSGVFLPSTQDLLGLQACPGEMGESVKISEGPRNTKGDVDCKFYSLQKFINLAAQGQPGQLELLFAPLEMYEHVDASETLTPTWQEMRNNYGWFLSKKSVLPFIGFALAQAHKTTIKGDNLNRLRAVAEWGSKLLPAEKQEPLSNWIFSSGSADNMYRFRWPSHRLSAYPQMARFEFEVKENDKCYETFRIAGRQYDPGVKVKTFLKNIDDLIAQYGSRSEAAAAHGLDYKSLMHAYRLIGQAEELLTEGKISLPRPPKEIEFLKSVLNLELPKDFDWLGDITSRIDKIRTVLEPKSSLPIGPRWDKLGKLCQEILCKHILKQ